MNGNHLKNLKYSHEKKLKISSLGLAIGMLFFPVLSTHAAVVADFHQGQFPTVKANSNGSLTININSASPGGISHNKFTQFDVTNKGVVLNNSAKNSSTEIAGNVIGNKNMANGSASLIINEVTQNRASQLNGMIEVAGEKANVIISNPAGITCSGCGFINTAHSTLTTGKPVIESDRLTGINVQNGNITVTGNGMSDKSDYTALLAKTVNINAKLKAKDLQIVGGVVGKIDSANNPSIGSAGAADKNLVGVDVSALGGMYANKITLVTGNDGIGVNNKGLIFADSTLSINSQGQINNQGTMKTSTDDIQLIAGNINNDSGSISSTSGNIMTFASNNISNVQGRIVSNGSFNANGGSFDNKNGLISVNDISIVADKFQNSYSNAYILKEGDTSEMKNGGLQAKSDISINSNSTLYGYAGNFSSESGTASLTSNSNINIDQSHVFAKNINITGEMIGYHIDIPGLNGTKMQAENDINFNVGRIGNFTSTTVVNAGHDINFNTIDEKKSWYFTNEGVVIAANNINYNHGSKIENTGTISAGNDINIKTTSLINKASINSKGKLNISASQSIINEKNAIMSSNSNMLLKAPTINNGGNIVSYGDVDIYSNSLTNTGYMSGKKLNKHSFE